MKEHHFQDNELYRWTDSSDSVYGDIVLVLCVEQWDVHGDMVILMESSGRIRIGGLSSHTRRRME